MTKSDAERCAEYETFKKIDAAFRAGDLAALRAAVDDPAGETIALLLSFGSDLNQRGINDYTPLHMAVSLGNLPALTLLLDAGADPHLRTRIEECETPREMALKAGLREVAELLAAHEERLVK